MPLKERKWVCRDFTNVMIIVMSFFSPQSCKFNIKFFIWVTYFLIELFIYFELPILWRIIWEKTAFKLVLCFCVLYQSRWVCDWMHVSSFQLSHRHTRTHEATGAGGCVRGLWRTKMQSSLVVWLGFSVFEALCAASWTLSRSSKLPVCVKAR